MDARFGFRWIFGTRYNAQWSRLGQEYGHYTRQKQAIDSIAICIIIRTRV